MTDGRLGDMQLIGGAGEAEVAGGRFEGPHSFQGGKAAHGDFALIFLIYYIKSYRLWGVIFNLKFAQRLFLGAVFDRSVNTGTKRR